MLHKIQTLKEPYFRAHNPYANGIDGLGLAVTTKTLREVREALEMEVGFRGEVGERQLRETLAEARKIEKLLRESEGA